MKSPELKFLLKLLGYEGYRASITQLNPTSKTKASERDKICCELSDRGIISYLYEVQRFSLEPAGKALIKQNMIDLPLSEQQITILQACATKSITPGELKKIPNTERQPLIQELETKGFLKATKVVLKEVWLTDEGYEYLKNEYVPNSGGNITLSSSQLQTVFIFLRQSELVTPIAYSTDEENAPVADTTSSLSSITHKPTDEEILDIIQSLDEQFNTDNYLPIFHLRKKLQPPFSREELDKALYRLQRQDKIALSTLQEGKRYTNEQIEAGIPQPIGGHLFFIILA